MSDTPTQRSSKSEPHLRYCFSLDSNLSVPERERLAKGPLGTRINVVYEEGRVFTDRGRLAHSGPSSTDWSGLTGKVLCGGDIFLVRPDAVLMLDGRLTIRSDDGVLVDVVYKGALDLSAEKTREVVRGAVQAELPHALLGTVDAQDQSFADFGETLRNEIDRLADLYRRIANLVINQKVAFYCALTGASQAISTALPDEAKARADAVGAIEDVIAALFPIRGNSTVSEKDRELKKAREHALTRIREKLPPALSNGLEAVEKQITIAYREIELDISKTFISGFTGGDTKSIELAVNFETSSGPWSDVPGEDTSWVSKDYVAHQSKFWKYHRLMRRNFVAVGELEFEKQFIGLAPVARRIHLCFYELDAGSRGGV